MPATKWLEMLLQHVPDRGEHLVRYYGWYSNRARGTRNAEMAEPEAPDAVIEGMPEQLDPEVSRAARAAWARLIKKVYEADPLICPHCGGEMRFTSHILVTRPSGQLKVFKIAPGDFVCPRSKTPR